MWGCGPKRLLTAICHLGTPKGNELGAVRECTGHSLFLAPAPAGRSRQIFDYFVNQETQRHQQRSLPFVFVTRKTLNQRSLLFALPRKSPGDCIA
jgi:hypothetical protein